MSVQTSAARSAGGSAGAATAGLLTASGALLVFVAVFLAFLLAPLLLLGVAVVGYLLARLRTSLPAAGAPDPSVSHHGFGAGAQ